MGVINKYAPLKWASSRKNVPWPTHSIRCLRKKKQKLYNKAKKNHSPRDWDMFKSWQHNCVAALRTARWNYINNTLSDTIETGNTKPFWRYVKSQKQEICGMSPLKQNGALHSDSSVKAKIMNYPFSSVFTADDHNRDSVPEGPSIPPISDLHISESGVKKRILNINPNINWRPRYHPLSFPKGTCRRIRTSVDTHL